MEEHAQDEISFEATEKRKITPEVFRETINKKTLEPGELDELFLDID